MRGLSKAIVVGFGGLLAVILVLGLTAMVSSRSSHRPACRAPKPHSKALAIGASAPESFTGGGILDVDGRLWTPTEPAASPIAGGERVDGTVTRTAADVVVFRAAAGGQAIPFRPTEFACQ